MLQMYKKTISLALALIMTLSLAMPAFADEEEALEEKPASDATEKQEVIYVNLDEGGNVSDVSVVNIFDLKSPGTVNDYGKYSSVRNMTSNDPVKYQNGKVTIKAPKGKLYYEGTVSDPVIPWNIELRYFLDGKEMSSKDIAGKSGSVKVVVDIGRNEECGTCFFENFTIEASVSFDTEKCSNIASKGATMANVGKNKQLSFILLPNQESEIEITMDTTEFAMSSFAFNGIQLSLDLDEDLLDSDEIDDKVSELTDAVAELDDGVQELLDGVIELDDGVQELADGVTELDDKVGELRSGVAELASGANDAYEGSADLSNGLDKLKNSNTALMAGAKQIVQTIIDGVKDKLNDSLSPIYSMGVGLSTITDLTLDNYGTILPAYSGALSQAAAAYPDPYKTMLLMASAGIDQAKGQIDTLNTGFYQGLAQYTDGVAQAATGANKLSSGLYDISDGCDQVLDGVKRLKSEGTRELRDKVSHDLKDGTSDLVDGVQELKDGTGEFRDKTKDIKGELKDKIEEAVDDILGKEITLESFMSDENDKIDSVQFVIKTPEIKAPEPEAPVAAPEADLNFWQKLLKLFGIEF